MTLPSGLIATLRGVALAAKKWRVTCVSPGAPTRQYIAAIAAYSLMQIEELIKCAEITAAMSIQGFSASRTFYQLEYDASSSHQDRHRVAANLRTLLEQSNHFELPHCNKAKQP